MTASKKGWDSRSVGTPWQHNFFYQLIRLGGRHLSYLFLYPVVLYYTLFRPDQRAKARYYLERRFPGRRGPAALLDDYRLILMLGRALVDRALIGIRGPEALHTRFPEEARLSRLAAEDRGLILLTSHVGCWQAAMVYLARLGRPVHMLMERNEGDIDRHYFEHQRRQCPYRIIEPSSFLGGSIEMVAALKRGEIVAIMGDRLGSHKERSLNIDFLGAPAPFPVAAWKLAAATGAPVAILFPVKTGPDSYIIELAEIIEVPPEAGRPLARLQPYLARYVAVLENLCRRHPFQFFNFYDLWKSPDDHLTSDT